MEARKLTTADERLEGARLIATAFLHNWDEEAERARLATATDDVWGLFDDDGTMDACIQTKALELAFEGTLVPAGELEMVGSLPERRGGGAVRTLELVQDFGHSAGRNYAASGTTPPSGANAASARSKNSPMSSAGARWPTVECGRRRL